jgi:selenocysteine lyase/cysteine desulfurase
MLSNQSHLFEMPSDITYLNCAYMSPILKSVEYAGQKELSRKKTPWQITVEDFFKPVDTLKKAFADLIHLTDYERIAVIPSVSYGIANVVQNIRLKPQENIVITAEQFPSNVYPWMELVKKSGANLRIVSAPDSTENRGQIWNEKILAAIDSNTRLVAMGHVHWTDGTLFDLLAIRQKSRENNALLVIDGTQSVGALPFDVRKIQPDALICAGYKWLLGGYGLSLAYMSEYFDGGETIEQSWVNRADSDNFQMLVNYKDTYRPKAARYSMGEQSNFVLVAMLAKAIEQILDWGVQNIQDYCQSINQKPLALAQEMGFKVENPDFRSQHLFGIRLNDTYDLEAVKKKIIAEKIYVSYRGNAIRVAPHLYNTEDDLMRLVELLGRY